MTHRTCSIVALCALLLAACSEGGIGVGRYAECRADADRVLHVQAGAPCPGRGTPDAPFCRMRSVLTLIQSDGCPAPWVIEAQGEFAEALEFNNDLLDTGPPVDPPVVNVTIKGGTYGGWPVSKTLVELGNNVSLTLQSVRLTDSSASGINCKWGAGAPPSAVRLRNVMIDHVRDPLHTSSYCSLDADGLTVDAAFGAVSIAGPYRIVNSEIRFSANYNSLLWFDNEARGTVDGLRFRSNLARYSLIDCGQLPRELRHLDIIHRGTVFADETTCKRVESTVEILP